MDVCLYNSITYRLQTSMVRTNENRLKMAANKINWSQVVRRPVSLMQYSSSVRRNLGQFPAGAGSALQ